MMKLRDALTTTKPWPFGPFIILRAFQLLAAFISVGAFAVDLPVNPSWASTGLSAGIFTVVYIALNYPHLYPHTWAIPNMPLLIVLTDALFLLFYTGVLCAFFKLASEYLQSNCTNQEINNWLSVARCRNGRVAVGMAMLLLLLFLATFALATGAYAVRGCTGGAAEEQWEKLELGGNPKVVERQELPGQTRIAIQGQGDRVEESGDREESGGGEGSGMGNEPEAEDSSTRESIDAGDAGGVAIADDKCPA